MKPRTENQEDHNHNLQCLHLPTASNHFSYSAKIRPSEESLLSSSNFLKSLHSPTSLSSLKCVDARVSICSCSFINSSLFFQIPKMVFDKKFINCKSMDETFPCLLTRCQSCQISCSKGSGINVC